MADKGKASRETVEALIGDIKDFIEVVNMEIDGINKDAKDLSSYWNDAKYEEFLQFIDELGRTLSNQLSALEDVNSNLRSKLNLYD